MPKEIIVGFLLIIVGLFAWFYTSKHPNSTFKSYDFKGYIGGFFLILIGILLLIGKLHW